MSEDHFGPVDFVVVGFSEPAAVRPGFDRLLALVDDHRIRVIDLEFVRNVDGQPRTVPAAELGPGFDVFDGASSGLLDRDDLASVTKSLSPGTVAAVLVYEELSILEVIETWERDGAAVVAEGPVDLSDLDAALDEGV